MAGKAVQWYHCWTSMKDEDEVLIFKDVECNACHNNTDVAVGTRSEDPYIWVYLCRECLEKQISLLKGLD
jgi:hypothetical protein